MNRDKLTPYVNRALLLIENSNIRSVDAVERVSAGLSHGEKCVVMIILQDKYSEKILERCAND